ALISENAEAISPFGVGRAFSLQMPLGLAATLFLNLGLPHVVGNGSGWPTWMVISAICCLLIGSSIAIVGSQPQSRKSEAMARLWNPTGFVREIQVFNPRTGPWSPWCVTGVSQAGRARYPFETKDSSGSSSPGSAARVRSG